MFPNRIGCDGSRESATGPAMTRCARCCLHNSMRTVNVIMLLFGIGMIIYALWLGTKWHEGTAELPYHPSTPRPWFIFINLGVGIAVCLSALCGHMLANCVSSSTLCMYIITICCLLFLEVDAIVAIFFKVDWIRQITAYIGEDDKDFKCFVMFHIWMSRMIALLIWAAQIIAALLAVIIWAVGIGPGTHCSELDVPQFSQSFLVPNPPRVENSRHAYSRRIEILRRENPLRSFLSYIEGVIRLQFQR